ncbi:hypothetical protein Hdeb2414_s0474g00901441 [Helianthus debilis subsp. tardiflorus]
MNNGKGGCCIAKYPGSGGNGFYMSKVDKIMLKFRPIAPKPVATGSGSGGSSDGYVKCVRSKRKYVRVKKSKNDNFKRQKSSSEKTKVKVKVKETPVVTLPLLPESPDRKLDEPVTGFCSDLLLSPGKSSSTKNDDNNNNNCCDKKVVASAPVWLRFDGKEEIRVCSNVTKPSPPPPPPPPPPRVPKVVSYVTVDCVTDTWVDWEALGCTDEEIKIKMNMEKDTCPGFISDGQDRVVWMNTAYKQLVGEDDVAVVLVRKEKWPVTLTYVPAFTCKVRVTSVGSQSHRKTCFPTLTLPCDVWRMKFGTCAWRLDVKAALSLGR